MTAVIYTFMTTIMYSSGGLSKGASVRVSREEAAANRERILEVAGTLFREHGFDGIGVADIMKQAGLTHGGFYGHFASKDDLAAEMTGRVATREGWMQRLSGKATLSLTVAVGGYRSLR